MIICPHCKRPVYPKRKVDWDYEKRLFVYRGEIVHFQPVQADIFNELYKAGGRPIHAGRLERRIFGLLELDPANNLYTQISKMRKRLPEGVNIHNAYSMREHDTGGYWLEIK